MRRSGVWELWLLPVTLDPVDAVEVWCEARAVLAIHAADGNLVLQVHLVVAHPRINERPIEVVSAIDSSM